MYLPVTLILQLADRSIIVTGFFLIAIGSFEPLVQRVVFVIQKSRESGIRAPWFIIPKAANAPPERAAIARFIRIPGAA